MHLGDACDCGKAVLKAASPASTVSFGGNYILARVVGFLYEASWVSAVVCRVLRCNAGLWDLGGVCGGCAGEKAASAGSPYPWKLDRETRGGEGKEENQRWFIHGLGLLAAVHSSILYCFFLTSMSETLKGFDYYQIFRVLEDPGRGTTLRGL